MTDHNKTLLAHLNDISPDTFDEGNFGPWSFTDVSRSGATWTLQFDNSLGSDSVAFTFDGSGVDDAGGVQSAWFDEVNTAILGWEADNGDGDGDGGWDE